MTADYDKPAAIASIPDGEFAAPLILRNELGAGEMVEFRDAMGLR